MRKIYLALTLCAVFSVESAAAQGYYNCTEEQATVIAKYAFDLGLTRSVPVIESCNYSANIAFITGTSSGAGITIYADFNTYIYEFYGKKMGLSTERRSTKAICVDMHSQTKYESVERDGKETCSR